MRKNINEAEWKVRVDLAAMFRLTHMMGWDDTVWNHITARAPETDHTFFMHQFGLVYEEVKASNLIKVDENGKVLKGDRKLVKSLDLKPGDLQIFKGRFSMHRVTKIEGKTSRYIALPCYVKDPLKINKPEHSKQVYGKALPIHFKRENIRGDGLTD